jgi:hypothetical protein
MPKPFIKHASVLDMLAFEFSYSVDLVALPHPPVSFSVLIGHFSVSMHHVFFYHSLKDTSVLEDDDSCLMKDQRFSLNLKLSSHLKGYLIETDNFSHLLVLARRIKLFCC